MAVTNQQIIDYLLANPNLSDAQIVSTMEQFKISPAQLASAVNLPEGDVISRVAATIPEGMSVTLGDTRIAPQYEVRGSGEDRQVVGIENITVEKTTGDINYKPPIGAEFQNYSPNGEFIGTGKVTSSGDQSFFGGLVDALKDPVVLAALGGAYAGGLFGTAGTAATGSTAFELANAGIAGGTAAFTPAQLALIEAGASGAEVAAAGGGLLTSAAITPAAVAPVAGAVIPAATGGGLLSSVLPASVADAVTKVGTGVATGLLTKGLADTVSGVAQTAGSLIQSQESKEAAQQAATDITKATQAGVEASQFRPVGMTTRFGTSNYTYDPVTGRMTSAGYQLSPEAKLAQDRLVKLANRGLYQAEAAQEQFAPLQTAAQNLYSLGSRYIAKSPEEAAQDYINKQMQLIAPSREMDLANLQNRLFQQGRTGVSVAQGGSLGATTPELQALYNARAQQELQLAANAQREGRENTLFGSNLYDLGTAKLSNYYGGQTQAYAPYTTALGQVQNLESLAQQPLQMGASLGQQSATAGANAARIGLTGQQLSSAYNTGANATFNPFAGLLTAAGNPNSMFGQAFSSLFSPTVPPVTAMSAPATSYGAGNYYGNQDVLGVWGT